MQKKYLIFILIFLILTTSVLAYVDPGTGGMIISKSIWSLILPILVILGGFFLKFFKPIKRGFLKLWRIIKKD